jgi:hypothetical protein
VRGGNFSPDEELDIKRFFPDHVRKGVKPATHLCNSYLMKHRNDKGRTTRDIQDKVKNLHDRAIREEKEKQ